MGVFTGRDTKGRQLTGLGLLGCRGWTRSGGLSRGSFVVSSVLNNHDNSCTWKTSCFWAGSDLWKNKLIIIRESPPSLHISAETRNISCFWAKSDLWKNKLIIIRASLPSLRSSAAETKNINVNGSVYWHSMVFTPYFDKHAYVEFLFSPPHPTLFLCCNFLPLCTAWAAMGRGGGGILESVTSKQVSTRVGIWMDRKTVPQPAPPGDRTGPRVFELDVQYSNH